MVSERGVLHGVADRGAVGWSPTTPSSCTKFAELRSLVVWAVIPAVLLARMALNRTLAGHGLGAKLFREALARACRAAELAAARVVVVDAIDADAAAFYVHFGFRPMPDHPLRLVRTVSDIAAALRQSSA